VDVGHDHRDLGVGDVFGELLGQEVPQLRRCKTGGNRVRAAKALRISYRALLYKIKRVGLARIRPTFSPTLADLPEAPELWNS